MEAWSSVSGLNFYEVPYSDSRKTSSDTDFPHFNIALSGMGARFDDYGTLAHSTFPEFVDPEDIPIDTEVPYHPLSDLDVRRRSKNSGETFYNASYTNWYSAEKDVHRWTEEWSDVTQDPWMYSFGNVLLHEIGHAFGLAHNNDLASVMYPIALGGPRSYCQLQTLTDSDTDSYTHLTLPTILLL